MLRSVFSHLSEFDARLLQRRCFSKCSRLQMVFGRRPSPPLSLGVLAVSGCELLVDAGAD